MRLMTHTLLLSVGLAAFAAGSPLRAQPASPAKPAGPRPVSEDARKAADWIKSAFKDQPLTEAAEMLVAIARGSQMGSGDGWFKPGQSRYGWKWLAERHGVPEKGSIPKSRFQ